MKIFYIILFGFITCFESNSQVSANWDISIEGNTVTLSIVEFNNFTVGLDGHWHYILDEDDYVAVHDINDVVLTGLSDGDHSIYVWLVDHMHNAINPPVEETFNFNINTGLSINNNEILDVMIYPNPLDSDQLNIISSKKGVKEIIVYSITGEKIIDTITEDNILDLSSMINGLYLLKVTINGRSKVSQLVIK